MREYPNGSDTLLRALFTALNERDQLIMQGIDELIPAYIVIDDIVDDAANSSAAPRSNL